MRTAVVILLVVGATSSSLGLVRAYSVAPVKAQWSGWTDTIYPNNRVSEVITCNFDELDSASGGYVELFAGFHGASGNYYHLGIYEYPAGPLVASRNNLVPGHDHTWLKFDRIRTEPGEVFTKGKKYEFRFTRSGSDSIQYYYDTMCGYHYGQMIAPYPPTITPSYGLAMRVCGRMNPVDTSWWGYQTWLGSDTVELNTHGIPAKARNAGVGTARIELRWSNIWPKKDSAFRFANSDAEVAYATTTMGCQVIGLLDYTDTAEWASSRIEIDTTVVNDDTTIDTTWCEACPPRNLYAPVSSDTNYWYRYVRGVVQHYDSIDPDLINVWEVWNEPNDTARFWKVPNTYYVIDDTVHDLCSLYARLCVVAESAISSVRTDDTVLVGSLVCMQPNVQSRIHPAEMLGYCYQYGQGAAWDGVSAHYYTDPDEGFDPSAFDAYAETLRMVMRGNGDYGGLWLTETGRSVNPDSSVPARYLCEAFTTAAATGALPQGGYDGACYYCFREDGEHYGVLDAADDTSRPAYYAACQTASALTDKRFNRRVMDGDTAIDNHTRVYEFEDTTTLKKRTWVCWQDEVAAAFTPLPVRNDEVDTVALAYNSTPPASQKDAEPTGWLNIALQLRPAFVMEKQAASRPDLVVDSVKYALGVPDTVLAWVTNRGTRPTPRQSPGNQPYPTWAVLYANGDSLAQQVHADTIAVSQQVTFRFSLSIAQPAAVLLVVKVNPAQTYVELGTDDNSGYRLKAQP